jgi:hypothetical protein
MRTLLRFVIVGTLIVSCSDGIGSGITKVPEPPCLPPDTVFAMYTDSLMLPVGATRYGPLHWYDQSCQDHRSYPPWAAQWVTRDSTVAAMHVDPQDVQIEALTPGRATIVASGGGQSDSMTVIVPDTVSMGRVISIAAAGQATCAVDEGGVVYCWGDGIIATAENGLCYGAPCTMPIRRTTGAVRVSIGGSQACALDSGGAARCWMNGYSGEPLAVAGGVVFSELTLAGGHACGLGTDAKAYCWGSGNNGELGTGARASTVDPTAVAGDHSFVSIGARDATSCGVTEAGKLLCWGVLGEQGANVPGAIQCSTTYQDKSGPVTYYVTCALSPIPMPLLAQGADTTFASVNGTCAVTTQGSAYCHRNNRMERVVPPGSLVTIVSGGQHLCGLSAGGEARCWGEGYEGQLGNGTMFSSSMPVTVAGSHLFTEIAAGDRHTCGLAVAGDVWCWGANGTGQAGVPIRSDTRVPQRVRGQP